MGAEAGAIAPAGGGAKLSRATRLFQKLLIRVEVMSRRSSLGLVFLLATFAPVACLESSDNPTLKPSGGLGGAGSPAVAEGGSEAGLEPELGTDLPIPDCAPALDHGVRMVGRYDGCDARGPRFSWPGTGFVARFQGTGLAITLDTAPGYYTVLVDGAVSPELTTVGGVQSDVLISGLGAAEHVVELYRQGEASLGSTVLLGVEVTEGNLLAPPPASDRRIELLGDSISAGYGNEGADSSCSFSAETENHFLTYGAVLARHFDAELSTLAWSGKGVVFNYGGNQDTPLPEMMDRAHPASSKSVWDYQLAPAPDVVLINLGTNDFSSQVDPTAEVFTAGYVALLARLRARYPGAHILCTVGPMLSGTDLDAARSGIEAAVTLRQADGDQRVSSYALTTLNSSPGCGFHPSTSTHAEMATELAVPVAAALGW